MIKFNALLVTIAALVSSNLWAKQFTTGYIQFELPPGWECYLEGTEYVCQSENEDRKKEAIMILAAKKKGDQDSLAAYKKYLNAPRTYTLPGNKKQVSEAKHVQSRMINGHNWVDALHLASEVPGFYTRYLATIKAGIGVAVTFSVTKSMYDAYKGIFDDVIRSMRVFAQENPGLNKIRLADSSSSPSKVFGDEDFVDVDEKYNAQLLEGEKKGRGSSSSDDFLFLIIIGVVGFLIFAKMKKKKKV